MVHDIKVLRRTFDDYENRCKKGNTLSFWGLASFSTDDDVLAVYAGEHQMDAIVYSCNDLDCVSIQELSAYPTEKEVMPLPPSVFEIVLAQKVGPKLVIGIDQMDHREVAYMTPKQN